MSFCKARNLIRLAQIAAARRVGIILEEIAQLQDRHGDAMARVERLLQIDPSVQVVLLSFAELALDTSQDRALMDRVVRATAHVENEIPVDTAILLYRGKALAAPGLPDAAIDVFTLARQPASRRTSLALRSTLPIMVFQAPELMLGPSNPSRITLPSMDDEQGCGAYGLSHGGGRASERCMSGFGTENMLTFRLHCGLQSPSSFVHYSA